ncbi:MAG: pyridoxal 5'-phosphate synthase, partial [Thermoflexales bacterium]
MSPDLAPHQHPIDLLLEWIALARAAGARRPLAMALATASLAGLPSVRMVIARRVDRAGITFYTDARSAKGRDLATNPRAATTFYWAELNRSVRISGLVEVLPRSQTEAFFAGYGPTIQRAMRVSTQSAPLADRSDLERAIAADAVAYPNQGPIAPGFIGYRIVPAEMEFWAEASDALHERVVHTRSGDD